MPSPALTVDEAEISDRLRGRGQRVTAQRLILLRVLAELGRHVTAEEVLHAATERLPNLSLPTVYATLDLYDELGVVRRVDAGPGPVLYDPRVDEHHHLICRRCGGIEDLDAALDASPALAAARGAGFRPDRADVVLAGVCARCSRP